MYKLKQLIPKHREFVITIEADYNDADTTTATTTLDEESFNEGYEILKFLVDNYGGSHQFDSWDFDEPDEDILEHIGMTEEEWSDKAPYIDLPYCDWGRCHTLVRIDIKCYDVDGKCYEVIL